MTDTGIATRYAHALVDALTSPAATGIDARASLLALDDFNGSVASSHDLHLVLISPIVSRERKRAVLGKIADAMQVDRLLRNFLFVLSDHRRLPLLNEIAAIAPVLLDQRLGFLRADLSAAAPLSDDEQRQIAEKLEEITGKRIRIQVAVEPELIGGVIARVGSKVYDGSVKGRLRSVAERLATESR